MTDPLPERAIDKLLAHDPALDIEAPADLPARYVIEREIGRGGMGVVYAAFDVELGREVALKVLADGAISQEARERFLREARATARLDHPGIATVYDASERYIAMRLVRGEPLERCLGVPRQERVRFVRDAARAVRAAHEQGIVHRDLKPGNILIEDGRAIVTDFGLAKDLAHDVQLSQSGQILGTPAYMAPEQASGSGQRADERTDVYGLAATLHFVLTGKAPFERVKDEPLVGVLRRVVEDDVPSPRRIDHTLDRDLEIIVLRGLEKDPSRRYPTALALADDLTRFLEGRPIEARAPSATYRLRRFVARHRGAVILASALALVLGATLLLAWQQSVRRVASSEALALSDRVNGWLRDAELCERLGETERRDDLLERGLSECREFLARHDVAWGHVLEGRLFAARRDAERALGAFDRALELDAGLASARLARGVLLAGEIFTSAPGARLEDPAALTPALAQRRNEALADLERALAQNDLTRTESELGRADRAALLGDRVTAAASYREVLRLEPTHVRARYGLLAIELAEGRDDEALGLAMSALDLHRGLGAAYVARSRIDSDAEVRAEHSARLAEARSRVERGEASARAYSELATLRLEGGDVDGALADFTHALERDPSDALAHGQRGLAQVRRAVELVARDPERALDAWRGAIVDFTAAVTIEPTLVGAINDRGVARLGCERILSARGDFDGARRERDAAFADFDAAVALDPRFGLALLNRAIAQRRIVESDQTNPNARERLAAARRDVEAFLSLKAADPSALAELNRLRAAEEQLPAEPRGQR